MEEKGAPPEGSVDYFLALGFKRKEAVSLAKSWAYVAPTDPQEALKEAHKGRRHEEKMKGLNYDLREGLISNKEYQRKAKSGKEK